MTEQNFEYLKDNLKYLGFGEQLTASLRQQMMNGGPAFQLNFETEINRKAFAAVLNFRKSDQSDMYFLNSFHATLQRSNGEMVDQVFYLERGKGVTAKEAYNLLEGRAVLKELTNKDGQSYKAWLQIDFGKKDKNNNHEIKQFHENYGYDLKASLEKFNIREMKEPDLADILMQSLKKGNLQGVAMEREGGVTKMFIEANPQYKTMTVYDAQFRRMQKEELAPFHSVQQAQGKEVKPEQKEELNKDQKKSLGQKNSVEGAKPRRNPSRRKGTSV